MDRERKGILVLCTGNSARSQMAEAYLTRHLPGRDIYSAGSQPVDQIHPMTVEVLQEVGFDLTGKKPKHLRDYLGRVPVQSVIIVCSGANEACPAVWPGAYERLFWPFDDPAAFEGPAEERRARFREVRDAIEEKVRRWVAEEQG